jgi:endonuclease YncB( thermonuclease family)
VSGPWTVPATVVRVIDGDSLLMRLDLGWHITLESRCRLVGCSAPDLGTEDGQEARAFLAGLLNNAGGAMDGSGAQVTFLSHELDRHGCPIGQVIAVTPQGETLDLGYELIDAGHAVPM